MQQEGPDQKTIDRLRIVGLSRRDVSKILKISVSTVRLLEKDGTLHPVVIDKRTKRSFDPIEVERARITHGRQQKTSLPSEGMLAAQCFDLFDRGFTLVEIVKELKLPIHVIRDQYAEYRKTLEDDYAQRIESAQKADNEAARKIVLESEEREQKIQLLELKVRETEQRLFEAELERKTKAEKSE